MSVLDKKLLRDVMRLKMQSLAIALVMACGVATIILATGAMRSLEDTRSAFYERYRFADIFASVNRAPIHLKQQIQQIPGVSSAELSVRDAVLLDIVGMKEPGTGLVVSIPDAGEVRVNQLYIRKGRLPDASRHFEVAVVESFATAHGFGLGDQFQAIFNGRKRTLTVVGVVLSPEFIYSIGPGDMVPDQRRFGVFFMTSSAVSALFDMQGAFNSVAIITVPGMDKTRIIDDFDTLLKRYGGSGAYARKDQVSHSFLDNELTQLRGTVAVVPPIFLLISAFLVNMILSRLIALEREQIGLLKAVGYSAWAIAWHYLKLVLLIAIVGVVIGSLAGTWLGQSLTRLYGEFFKFPFLIFRNSLDLYLVATAVTCLAAMLGAAKAIWQATSMSPAVAMQPPAPKRYRSYFPGERLLTRLFSQLSIMALRHLLRWPIRTFLTTLGTAMSVAILIASLFAYDSIDFMIDTVFFKSNRQDATLIYPTELSSTSLQGVQSMPGVLAAEPFRQTAVILRNKRVEKRLQLLGVESTTQLSRILDHEYRPISVPPRGLMLSNRLARSLHLRVGDLVDVELVCKNGRRLQLPVTGLANSLIGLSAYMNIDEMNRIMIDGRRYSGAYISVDEEQIQALYQDVKVTPGIAGIALLRLSLKSFRNTIEQNISFMTGVYVALAVIITFGVIYNSARIQLSERARELASLRVFGFSQREVSSVLFIELGIIITLAQPLGWLIGYGIAVSVAKGFESDLFRIPLIINISTYATASLVVVLAAIVSALIVGRRVKRFDLVRVLKTRE